MDEASLAPRGHFGWRRKGGSDSKRRDTLRVSQTEPVGTWPPPMPLGNPLRFAVVDPLTDNRSATWRVWTGKKTDDVYLCESVTGGDWKVTHHNEWKWRIAMTKERAEADGVDRVVVVEWRDRQERGWSEGAGVLIPCAYLRPSQDPLPPSVVRVPPSAAHSSVRVRLLFEEPGAVGVRFGHGFPVGVLDRLGGGRVYVLADPVTLSGRTHREMAAACDEARAGRSPTQTYPTNRFVWVVRLGEQPVQVDLTVD